MNIREPDGKFILDIGGGITETAIISLSGVVSHKAVKIAGDDFDADIRNYFERNYYIFISAAMAELIKINIGSASVYLSEPPEPYQVIGKDLITGIPKSVIVAYGEVACILDGSIAKIEDIVIQTLEECPPELAGDIYTNGIYLTGGGALLRGLTERLELKTSLKVHLEKDAMMAVTKGISIVLSDPERYRAVLFK